MGYVKPKMEIVLFEQNVYMTLSLQKEPNTEGGDDDGDMGVDF